MGELLLKEGAGQTWDASNGWHGDSIADFKITDNWAGYSIGFDQSMTNGEYDKFVVDIVHTRDVMSYFGSKGNQELKEKYNALDSSTYLKKDLDGNILLKPFRVDQVQTVDNLWSGSFDATTVKHPIFGTIQGNTIAANDPFFSIFGQRSGTFKKQVFVTAFAETLSGINIDFEGHDPAQGASWDRWLTHQKTPKSGSQNSWLSSDGCIVNTDENMDDINSTLNSWHLYKGFNMGTVIREDWSNFYRNLYANH